MQVEPLGFGELYRRYAQDVFRFALYLSGNRALAEDIASETFVRAWTSPEPVRAATVKGYLFTIARNLYLQEMRRGWRRAELRDDLPDTALAVDDAAGQRQQVQAVLRAMQELPEVDRSALLMRAREEMSYEEIAAALGLSLAAVKVKIHRARLRLAQMCA